MPLSAIDAISPGFQHTKKQLLQPFRFWQWTRLAFVGLLAGELGSSGGCNAPSNFQMPKTEGGSDKFMNAGLWHTTSGLWHGNPALLAGLITVGIVAAFVLWLIFAYINSRMRFVLFDSVIAQECHIREYWSRRRTCGWRYFVWQILFALASLMVLVILVGIPLGIAWVAGWLREPSEHVLPLVLGGIPLFFLLLAVFIVLAVIGVMTKDFVVPYMAIEDVTAIEGWRRLWSGMKTEKGSYAGYIGMKIVLAIAAGIVFGIAALIALVIVAIPLFIVGVVIGIAVSKAALAWNALTITLAVLAGCFVVVLIIIIVAMISVPVAVFFPAYSIHFLASRYPRLDGLLHPAPPAPPLPPTPVIPPFMPPSLPPEPSPAG